MKKMGTYYFYINKSKSEYFCIDPTDQDIKQYAIGRNFGSRAFSLLMLNNDPDHTGFEHHKMIGSWIGDEILITGDDYDSWFQKNRGDLKNISSPVIEMMCDVAPGDFLQYGGEKWLITLATEFNVMPDEMRRRLLKYFREQRSLCKTDSYDTIIAALRPCQSNAENAG